MPCQSPEKKSYEAENIFIIVLKIMHGPNRDFRKEGQKEAIPPPRDKS
jgi:hypothetical protein